MNFSDAAPVIESVGMAAASGRPLDFVETAEELGRAEEEVRATCSEVERAGLIDLGEGRDSLEPPALTRAGRQYLMLGGKIETDCLFFLPRSIGDLHSRRALLHAGNALVNEFRDALTRGQGVEHAKQLVPPAFEPAITASLAVDLFAAAIALLGRLSAEEPAGCLAEEIVACEIVKEAEAWLQLCRDEKQIPVEEAKAAIEALSEMFDLFEDADVDSLFEMTDPADAALADHSHMHEVLGVVDTRVEAWFQPYGDRPALGHLRVEDQ